MCSGMACSKVKPRVAGTHKRARNVGSGSAPAAANGDSDADDGAVSEGAAAGDDDDDADADAEAGEDEDEDDKLQQLKAAYAWLADPATAAEPMLAA